MYKVFAIAHNTFREAIRDKILYAILFFALLMLSASLILGELSLGHSIKVTKDFGLTAISWFGVLIAIFTGVSLVHKEIDKKTIYTIISKPIHRYHFILGKYLGMVWTAFVQMLFLTLVFTLIMLYQQQFLSFYTYWALLLFWMEIMLIISVALFCSSFTTPFFSGLFTFSIFLLGRLMPDIHMAMKQLDNPAAQFILSFSTILPDLQQLNISVRVVHNELVSAAYLFSSMLYALSYIGIFLLLSVVLFSRRDFV